MPGSTTSGGLNWVGQVTSELNTTLVLTYDWAYYGADTSNTIINTGVTTDFIAQVAEFEEYLVPAPSEAKWTSSNTLVAVWMGINDVGECFWESSIYATCPITEVMDTYFGLLEDLYNDGVRKFALLMVPRGFLPSPWPLSHLQTACSTLFHHPKGTPAPPPFFCDA